MQNGIAAMENSMMIPQKIKIDLPYYRIPLPHTFLKDLKPRPQRDY